VHGQCIRYNRRRHLSQRGHERTSGEVLCEDTAVDGGEGVQTRETEGEYTEVSLEACINGEAPRRGVHAGDILGVVDLLKGHLLTVVPMTVV